MCMIWTIDCKDLGIGFHFRKLIIGKAKRQPIKKWSHFKHFIFFKASRYYLKLFLEIGVGM